VSVLIYSVFEPQSSVQWLPSFRVNSRCCKLVSLDVSLFLPSVQQGHTYIGEKPKPYHFCSDPDQGRGRITSLTGRSSLVGQSCSSGYANVDREGILIIVRK